MTYARHYSTETFTQRSGAFRFGGTISLENLKQEYYRDIFAHFLCRGLIEESVGKGFEVVDDNGEPLDWNDDFQEVLTQHLPELVRGLTMERRDGKALLLFMRENSKLVFRSYTREYYDVEYDDVGIINQLEARSQIANNPSYITHTGLEAKPDSFYELIFRRREEIGEGMSYLEPIWDYLIAIYFLISHSAYAIARVGAGVKKAKMTDNENMPIDPLDDDAVDDLMDKLALWGSDSDTLWVPPGVEVEMGGEISKIPLMEIFDIYLSCISAYSGVPNSRLVGLVPGQLEGAEVNEESYFDVLRDIQEMVKPVIRWFVERLNRFYEWAEEPDFDILFNVREEMSEVDQLDLDMKKLDLAEKYISAGFKREKAFEKAGVEFDSSDLEEEQDEVEQSPVDTIPQPPEINEEDDDE